MFKLYLRKIITTIAYFVAIMIFYYVCYPVLGSFANFFHQSPVRHIVTIGIPSLLVLVLIYKGRYNNQYLKNDYIKYIREQATINPTFDLKTEFIYLKTFPPLLAEAVAFITLFLPLVVAFGFKVENDASTFINCLAGTIIFILLISISLILDILCWLLVHKYWLKIMGNE